MPKAFDPDKARKEAAKTIETAETAKAKLVEKLTPAETAVTEAQKVLADKTANVAAAVEKATEGARKKVATATEKRDALKAKVAEQDALIARQQAYLAATENLDAAPAAQVLVPEGVPSGEAVGQF
jgi:hypothetical protein